MSPKHSSIARSQFGIELNFGFVPELTLRFGAKLTPRRENRRYAGAQSALSWSAVISTTDHLLSLR
jgi:hypothetical protein